MKKYLLILFLIAGLKTHSQNNSQFFIEKSFELKHFFVNSEVEEIILTDSSGNPSRVVPRISFLLNSRGLLESSIGGYCNTGSCEYRVHDSYLEVVEIGGLTLMDCGLDEFTDYFNPLFGGGFEQETPERVNYSFSEDKQELVIWLDENHQLVFSEIDGNLSVSENQLAASISVYPNPSKEIINININTINIDEVIVLNSKGSEVIRKKTDYNKIDISKLTSGIYFLRIKSKKGVFTTKKIIKN